MTTTEKRPTEQDMADWDATTIWYEARLKPGADLAAFYTAVDDEVRYLVRTQHHFWDEPWAPNAYVVRVAASVADDAKVRAALERAPGVDHVVDWDEEPDKALYGNCFGFAVLLFEGASLTAIADQHGEDWMTGKFVHCLLNARGMSEWDEARFALRFAWGRATIRFRLWWRRYFR